MPREEATSYIDELIQQMQENERQMKKLLSQANSMVELIDWPTVRKNVLASKKEKEVFNNMIGNMVDAYCGIVSNCAMFGAGCSLSAEFMGAANASNIDPTSLDWILNNANSVTKDSMNEQELVRLLDSFAQLADGATEGLKKSIVAAFGF